MPCVPSDTENHVVGLLSLPLVRHAFCRVKVFHTAELVRLSWFHRLVAARCFKNAETYPGLVSIGRHPWLILGRLSEMYQPKINNWD